MNESPLRWYHRLYVGLQYLLPQHLLSALIYRLTRVGWRPFRASFIRIFIHWFRVDMQEAMEPDPDTYGTFNAFFTRALRSDARPIGNDPGALVCPADGALSQFGTIENGRIFQAKGLDYSLLDLFGGNQAWADKFTGGSFATVYLSPRDYHRVHMPASGRLREMIHIPGRLFSVNSITAGLVPRLFSRNERLVCLFEGETAPMAIVLVGAIFVGSMDTVWAGQITPCRGQSPSRRYSDAEPVDLAKGEEMGRFNMGSTVILLSPPGTVDWEPSLRAGNALRMGQRLGRMRKDDSVVDTRLPTTRLEPTDRQPG